MGKMKKVLSILLSMLMLVSFVPTAFAGNSADSSAEAKLPTVFEWSQETPGVVEFETVPGVTEYELELKKTGESDVRTYRLIHSTNATGVFDTREYMLEHGKGEYSAKFVIKENGETVAETSEITYQYTYEGTLIMLPRVTDLTYSDGNFEWSADTTNVGKWRINLFACRGWKRQWIASYSDYGISNEQTSMVGDPDDFFAWFDEFLETTEGLENYKQYISLYAAVQAIPKDITTHTFGYQSYLVQIPRIAESGSVLPTTFKWSETTPGVVEFTAVPGVTEYSYRFMHTNETENVQSMGGSISSMDSGNISVDENGKGTVDLRWDILVNYKEGNHYTFNFVKTDSFDDIVEYSLSLEYDYTPSETQQALPKPTGLKYENNVLSWSKINADVLKYDVDFYAVCGDDVQKLNGGVTANNNSVKNNNDQFFNKFFDDYFEKHAELDKSKYSLYASVTAYPGDIINYSKSPESEKILIPRGEGGTSETPPASTKHTLTYKVLGKTYKEYELNKGEKISTPSENPSIDGYIFNGWEGIPTDGIMPDNDVTITAKMTLLTTIKGKVVYNNAPAAGAKVTVPNVADVSADENGNFSVADYPCGSFVANVEYSGMKTTVNVNAVSAETDLGEIEVKELGTSAVIAAPEVRSVTITDANALLSDEDKTFLETSGNTIIIETKAKAETSNAAIENEASTKYSDYTVGGIFLDLTVSKVKSDDPGNPIAITEANDLIAFEIEIPQAIKNKSEYIVLREHNGAIDVITSTPNADGEYLTVSGNVLTLYVKKFSVYSLYGKDVTPVRPSGGGGGSRVSSYTVRFVTTGGSAIDSVKVDKNKTVTEPTAPTRNGFDFAGWYTDHELTAKYDFDTKVTKSLTLYAAWTENGTEVKDDVTEPTVPTESVNSETKITFTDVTESAWFAENVKYVVENGLMNGTTATEFAPNNNLTRAMLVTILYRAAGEPEVNKSIPFADVTADSYYANAVIWAQQNSIVSGVNENEFAPDKNITREQIATIIYRYAKFKGYDTSAKADISSFTDADEISEYAVEAMQYAVASGLMNGKTETTLNPQDNATRAEIAAILQRFIEANK